MHSTMKKSISFTVLLLCTMASIFAQSDAYKIRFNEIFIHHKDAKKNWIELKASSKKDVATVDSLYLSTDKTNPTMWPVHVKFSDHIAINKIKYITVTVKSEMFPFPLSSVAYVQELPLKTSNMLYLYIASGPDSLTCLDSLKIGIEQIEKNQSLVRNPKRRSVTTPSKIITKGSKNLTFSNSQPKKSYAVYFSNGLGMATIRTTDRPYSTPLKYSWGIGIMRERQTLLKYFKLQYGMNLTRLNYGIKSHKIDTLTKTVNGEEQITRRENTTNGWKKSSRISLPFALIGRFNNKLSFKAGSALSIVASNRQYYVSDLNYYQGNTGELYLTNQITYDEKGIELSLPGLMLGLDYHINEKHRLSVDYLKYGTGIDLFSATGKSNTNYGFFVTYGFHFAKSKKRIPKYQLIKLN